MYVKGTIACTRLIISKSNIQKITDVIIAACNGEAFLQIEVTICLINLKNFIVNVFS